MARPGTTRRRLGVDQVPPGSLTIRVATAEDGQRLQEVLSARLPEDLGHPLSRSAVHRLIMAGAVACNGRSVRQPAIAVHRGDRLRVVVDRDRLGPGPPPAPPTLDRAALLHLDPWLVVVDKPPGVPTHATIDPDRPHLVAMVSELLVRVGAAGSGPEPPRLGIPHRLDRDTSGPVLFTLDPSVNGTVGALFADHRVEKRYWAVCTWAGDVGEPPERWEVHNYLGVVGRTGKRSRYGSVRSGGLPAQSTFRRLQRLDGRTWLIEGRPVTGRTHQLRVHLAETGLPVVGDRLYGGRPGTRVLLHCRDLAFPHPVTGVELRVCAEPPSDWPDHGHYS